MALETGNYIGDLVATNPTSSDPKSQGDDHLRLIKAVLKECFAGFSGAVIVTGTDGGAADAYTLTPTTALVGYVAKMVAVFTATATNATTTPTLNISGLGAKTLVDMYGNAVVAGAVAAGTNIAVYDGTYFRLIVSVPIYSVTATAGDNSTRIATTAFVNALAFAAALPAQGGNSGKTITTNGSTASWTAIKTINGTNLLGSGDIGTGAVLLATLTPTAAANVDFLSTFTSSYDGVLIRIDGVKPATNDALLLRLANGGSADTGSNYFTGTNWQGAASHNTATTSITLASSVTSAGKGVCLWVWIANVNDATNLKTVSWFGAAQTGATPDFINLALQAQYNPANAVSGGRLYWSGGANFSATGKVRIYGLQNS